MSELARLSPARTTAAARLHRGGRLAWTLLGLVVVLMAASMIIAFTGGETWNSKLAFIPVEFAVALVGAVVAARTGNRLGWLFLAAGTGGAVPHRGGGSRGDTRGGGAVQPGAAPGPADRGPAVQPGPLRRGSDGGSVRGRAQGRGRSSAAG